MLVVSKYKYLQTAHAQNRHGAFWINNDAKLLHADNEDSNQTARMRRLI